MKSKSRVLFLGILFWLPFQFSSFTTQSRSVPNSEQSAIAAFQNQAKPVIARVKSEAQRKFLMAKIAASEKISARRMSFSEALRRVESTLSEKERKRLIVYGSLAALRRPGACWELESFGGMSGEIMGYLDAKSGKLVFIWIGPEG